MIDSCFLEGGRALLASDCGGHQQAKCKGALGQAGPQLPTGRKATFWQSEATTAVRLLPSHQEEPPQEGPVGQGRSELQLQAPDYNTLLLHLVLPSGKDPFRQSLYFLARRLVNSMRPWALMPSCWWSLLG